MKLLLMLFLSVLSFSATAQTKIEFISPFSAGGSTLPFVRAFSLELEREKFSVDQKFLGNCRLASQVLNTEKNKFVYVWFSDLHNECPPPGGVTEKNLIGAINWSPLYLCGRAPTLEAYRTRSVAIGTNPGNLSTNLAIEIKNAINKDIRVVNYANTSAVKSAVVSNEIDLILHSSGKALEAEKQVTCYASTADTQIGNMVTVRSLIENTANSVTTNVGWFAGVNLTDAEMSTIRKQFNLWTATDEFQNLVTRMHREAPSGTISQQVIQINNSMK
jgi:tripartite-type tricarboxylate transporter receptor subunit TctC